MHGEVAAALSKHQSPLHSVYSVLSVVKNRTTERTECTDWVTDAPHRHTRSPLHSLDSVHSVVRGTLLITEVGQQPALARNPFRPPTGPDLLFQ